jgi:glutamine synthetase
MSVFLGEQLDNILNTIEKGAKKSVSKHDIIDLGVARLPRFNKDTTDRNRTSPFAFTGMKFEFRAVGSSQNISTPIMMINTIIADSLDYVADKIQEKAKKSDFNTAALQVIAEIIKQTKDIRFEGNNYSPEWVKEAARRKLPNIASTVEALKALTNKENISLFEKYKVLSKEEMVSRYHIWVETYCKVIEIEVNALNEMVNSSIVPPGLEYQKLLSDNLANIAALKNSIKLEAKALSDQKGHLSEVVSKIYYVRHNTQEMMQLLEKAQDMGHEKKAAVLFEKIKPYMEHIRRHCDELECVVADEMWDLPKYREMLFIK